MPSTLVVTSIHPPNACLRLLAEGCREHGWSFIVAGDTKSPSEFRIEGCRFLSLADQRDSGFRLGEIGPEKSYTRKNIGYLEAIRGGATVVVETDDDNHPRPEFWKKRGQEIACAAVSEDRWVNVYRYFTETFVYPRGLPLVHARAEVPPAGIIQVRNCPIQQGLADHDPDVDAIYRMLFPLPLSFEPESDPIYLDGGAWCPFNSQNTTFFAEAFPMLYLPAHCSFRMTDIWRSFVAQRVLGARGGGVLFHRPTVWQERNEHDLHRDFVDEQPGYVHNDRIRQALMELSIGEEEPIRQMMERCYEVLIRNGWVGEAEESLLGAWFDDLGKVAGP